MDLGKVTVEQAAGMVLSGDRELEEFPAARRGAIVARVSKLEKEIAEEAEKAAKKNARRNR